MVSVVSGIQYRIHTRHPPMCYSDNERERHIYLTTSSIANHIYLTIEPQWLTLQYALAGHGMVVDVALEDNGVYARSAAVRGWWHP
jgi:cell wall assembly regulator SMI1